MNEQVNLDQQALEGLLRKLRDKRRRISTFLAKFEPRGTRLMNIGIICGAIATALTAGPAIGGVRLTDALGAAGPNTPSWRVLCAAATFFSLLATIATNLFKSHDMSSRLAKAQACAAKLEALETLVELRQLSVKEATARYEECLPEIAFIPDERQAGGWFTTQPQLSAATASLLSPVTNQVVAESFNCSGRAAGLQPGLHLWLAVEIGGRMWPKEGELQVQDDGTWSKTVFEEGVNEQFSLSLFVTNESGHSHIMRWFRECDRTGNYPELRRTTGMLRLQRVTGLRRA